MRFIWINTVLQVRDYPSYKNFMNAGLEKEPDTWADTWVIVTSLPQSVQQAPHTLK